MKIICFINGIFSSIRCLAIVSGHYYREIYDNKDIQVLKCDKCNHISIGFKGDKYE